MTEETSEVRVRGQESQQLQEEASLRSLLMDCMREQNENFKVIIEKIDQQKKELNERFDEHFKEIKEVIDEGSDKFNKNLDSYTEEITQHMNEQFTLFRTEIREYKNTWKMCIRDSVDSSQFVTIYSTQQSKTKTSSSCRVTRKRNGTPAVEVSCNEHKYERLHSATKEYRAISTNS